MKRLGRVLAVLGMTVAMGATVTPAAGASDATDALEWCRLFDDLGVLDSIGLTFGECVNQIKETNETSILAAYCGSEFLQSVHGTTNKGECIQVVRSTP